MLFFCLKIPFAMFLFAQLKNDFILQPCAAGITFSTEDFIWWGIVSAFKTSLHTCVVKKNAASDFTFLNTALVLPLDVYQNTSECDQGNCWRASCPCLPLSTLRGRLQGKFVHRYQNASTRPSRLLGKVESCDAYYMLRLYKKPTTRNRSWCVMDDPGSSWRVNISWNW